MSWGATVKMRVAVPLIYESLHALEMVPDVFIIERLRMGEEEIWYLRSIDFPATWDGWWVCPLFKGRGNRVKLRQWQPHPESSC